MKIIIDSNKGTIRFKEDKADKKRNQRQIKANIMNIFAFAVVAMAKKYFKTPKAQEVYINSIHAAAIKILKEN